jgi:hypothetical protein
MQGAATEAGLSRIFAGQHTMLDHLAGHWLGAKVGDFTLRQLKGANANAS